MKTIKILFGFLPGVTFGMWLRAIWLCISLCICNPSDQTPLWAVFALFANLAISVLAVYSDRDGWKKVYKHSNNLK